jgi:hypothetical protein
VFMFILVILTCRKMLRHGASGFTSPPKEGVLRISIALKIHRFGRVWNANHGSNSKDANHYTSEAT